MDGFEKPVFPTDGLFNGLKITTQVYLFIYLFIYLVA